MGSEATLKVRVCIPHFFQEVAGGTGYGSGLPGARLARSVALSRCLSGLLALQWGADDQEIHVGDKVVESLPPVVSADRFVPVQLEIIVCTDGEHRLDDALGLYAGSISVRSFSLENPKELALACRDHLIQQGDPADLSVYLEDDLVIHDPFYFYKLLWFHERTEHQMCLMPHRYERLRDGRGQLLVDGPLRPGLIGRFVQPQEHVASGRWLGQQDVSFDLTANPHAGTFALSRPQLLRLRQEALPREGFVGPLETAATLTVLRYFPVLKPSRPHRRFLQIEHGHPSFLQPAARLPRRTASQPSLV